MARAISTATRDGTSNDVAVDFADLGVYWVAKRSVFVVDEDRTIAYRWGSDDPGVEPEYDAVEEGATAVAQAPVSFLPGD